MNFTQKNNLRAIIIYTIRSVVLLCSTGALMQTFLASVGFDTRQLYLHSTFLQTANVATIMLCSKWADKGNLMHRSAAVLFPSALLYLCYLPFCFSSSIGTLSFVYLLIISIFHAITQALITVCEYKLPYYIYERNGYGPVLAVSGIIASLASFFAGLLMSALSAYFPYKNLMLFALIFACLLLLTASLLQLSQKIHPHSEAMLQTKEHTEEQRESVSVFKTLTHPLFYRLLPANLLRGLANGLTTVLAVAAIDIGYKEAVTTAMVSAQSLATLLSCALFGVVSKKVSPRLPILAGSISFIVLPLILIKNDLLFLAVCFLVFFGRTLIDYGVPVALIRAVPVEMAGPYNAWRMILHNGGTLIATALASVLPVAPLIVLTVILQIISGLLFFCSSILRKASPLLTK